MEEKNSQKIIEFIKNESLDLGINDIGFTSINKINELKKNSLLNSEFPIPTKYFPNCKTIICAALPYNYNWNNASNSSKGYIARYTAANFYRILSTKLKKLGQFAVDHLGYPYDNDEIAKIAARIMASKIPFTNKQKKEC